MTRKLWQKTARISGISVIARLPTTDIVIPYSAIIGIGNIYVTDTRSDTVTMHYDVVTAAKTFRVQNTLKKRSIAYKVLWFIPLETQIPLANYWKEPCKEFIAFEVTRTKLVNDLRTYCRLVLRGTVHKQKETE